MRRRDLVVGAASLGALGVGGVLATTDRSPFDDRAVDPATVETLDAPGSDAGTMAVPDRGSVTFLDLFATWCSTCQGMMGSLDEVHGTAGDGVQFVSITVEPVGQTTTRTDVSDWWRAHDGSWTVGLDTDLQLTETFEVTETPTTVVLDERNVVTYTETGRKSVEELVEAIERARDS